MKFEAVFKVSCVRVLKESRDNGHQTVVDVLGEATVGDRSIASCGGSESLQVRWPSSARVPRVGACLKILITDEVVREKKSQRRSAEQEDSP